MRQHGRIHHRLFIVGCARSGTTLLQAMLAQHSRVLSLPETHFFWRAERSGVGRRLGVASRHAEAVLRRMTGELGRPDLAALIPKWSPFLRSHARAFCAMLDRVTIDTGRDVWLEKTPLHLMRLGTIARYVDGARFLHVVRDGRDVVASLYEAARREPDVWGQPSTERCIRRWNRDVAITLAHAREERHRVVVYEHLLTDARAELTSVCQFLGLEFEAAVLDHRQGADRVLGRLAAKPWMHTVREPLQDTRHKKFREIFSEHDQRYIEDRLLYQGDIGAAAGPA
jgi:hypothetical protein